LLREHGIEHRYRDYREEPLSKTEIRSVLERLGVGAREVLRTRDRAFKESGLTGEESDARLIEAMSNHPTLLQRPIGLVGRKAVLGRPPEALLALVD